MFHCMANTLTTGGAVTLTDMPAVADGNFSIRNGHYIFSEPYRFLALAPFGATITALQSNTPHINYINPHQVYPANLAVTVPANPQVQDFRSYPMSIPQEEEVAWQVSDSANEQTTLISWIATDGWTMQLPRGIQRVTALFTCSYTSVANAWGADAVITQGTALRGGTYAVLGCQATRTNGIAFRLNFTRRPLYRSRKTLPGDLCANSYSLVPNRFGPNWLGLWGYFNTFEFPLLEVFANAAATATVTLYMDLLYVSERTGDLDQFVASMGA